MRYFRALIAISMLTVPPMVTLKYTANQNHAELFYKMGVADTTQSVCRNSTSFLLSHLHGLPKNSEVSNECARHTKYEATEACEIASSYNQILFFGESLCRHVSMALLSILRGNLENGATRDWEVPEGLNCSGEMQYTEYDCRKYSLVNSLWLSGSQKAMQGFCPGRSVFTRFLEWWRIQDAQAYLGSSTEDNYLRLEVIEPDSALVIYPPGLHADMRKPTHMLSSYVEPIVNAARQVAGTVVVIVGLHSMGPNMPAEYAEAQSDEVIVNFNYALRQYAETRGIGYMDTFNLTKGYYTSDGVHYGRDANLLKAQMILNFLDINRRETHAVM